METMWLPDPQPAPHPDAGTSTVQAILSAEALHRATRAVAEQAEALATEVERDPLLVDSPADALRLFASLIRDSAAIALHPTAGHA